MAEATDVLKKWVTSAILNAELTVKETSVLVLPHLSDMIVFLVQETLKEVFPSCVSFVLGPESSKRVVICAEKLLQRKVLQDAYKITTCTNSQSTEGESEIKNQGGTPEAKRSTKKRSDSGLKKRPEKKLYIPVSRRNLNGANIRKTVDLNAKSNMSGIESLHQHRVDSSEAVLDNSELSNISSSEIIYQPTAGEHWACLDKLHLDELLELLGPVSVLKPEIDMIDFKTLILLEEPSLGHIIEAYDFPSSFSTTDLQKALSDFKDYHIKWVNHTTALLLFRDIKSASETLTMRYPNIKLRPMTIASPAARIKVKKCPEFVLPYKERPPTMSTVARRLISFSLGIKTTKPEHIEEEKLLQKAREMRKSLKEKHSIES